MRTRPWLLLLMLSLVGLVGCDHATKLGAERELRGQPPAHVLPGVDLEYRQNPGVAFNVERALPAGGRTALIVGVGVLAMGLLGAALWRRRGTISLETAGLALVAAGALGNLLDRLLRGYVVDFIHVHHWPVWNVADAWIALGVAALLLGRRAPAASPPAAPTPAPA